MNTTTRIGKIARLSHSIREQLNLKLHDGIPAKSILPWLNSLPEVKSILATDFDSRPITKQNLSEWKQGGHRDWLLQYQASQFLQFTDPQSSSSSSSSSIPPTEIQDGTAQPQNLPDSLTHHASRITSRLLLWTQLQYTTMARHIDSETDPERKWNALRHFATDISRLRRSTVADDYLQIQRDWLALSQSNAADKKEKQFWKWTKRPDIEKKLFPNRRPGLTAEELYQFEKDCCLLDGPGPEIAELMAEVRIAKKLLEIRKAQEAEAKAKAAPDYDPNRPLPDTKVRLAGMPFEELFPTIPDKPLTQTHPELDDDTAVEESNDASKNPASSHQGSAGRAATGDHKSSANQSDSATLCTAAADFPLPRGEGRPAPLSVFGEGGGEGEATVHPPSAQNPAKSDSPALRSLSSVALLAKEDASDEGGSDQPALRSAPDEGGSDPVKPGQTQSNQIQPDSPLNPESNSTNDPF